MAAAVPLLLAACAETQLAVHMAKRYQSSEGGIAPDTGAAKGVYKVGQPYQINGVWYYPKEDPDYDETGIASWYGHPFHGQHTANGERYDMNDLSAAHKTLPLPTKVRVTNLENGRSLVLRVNDRGPFVNGRVIDVSRRAAQLLGFHSQGTAKVRVTALGAELPTQVAQRTETTPEVKKALPAVPRAEVSSTTLPPPPGVKEATSQPVPPPSAVPAPVAKAESPSLQPLPEPTGKVEIVPVQGGTSIFVQAGAFISAVNATKMAARLSYIGRSKITNVFVDGQELFRVRIGPLASVEQADATLRDVIEAGVTDARIIVD